MSSRSYTFPDFTETTGCNGAVPETVINKDQRMAALAIVRRMACLMIDMMVEGKEKGRATHLHRTWFF